MKFPNKKDFMPLAFCAIMLFIIFIFGIIFTNTSASGLFSLLFAIFFYLILPGYFMMLNFNFDNLERVIMGMIVSSAIIPAILYAMNIMGFKITKIAVIVVILGVILFSIIYRTNNSEEKNEKK